MYGKRNIAKLRNVTFFYRSSQSAPEKEAIPLMDYVLNVVSVNIFTEILM